MSISAAIRSLITAVRRRMATPADSGRLTAAEAAAAAGDWRTALVEYRAADRLRPLKPAPLAELVALLARHDGPEAAEPFARRLLQARPGNRRALRVLSRLNSPGLDVIEGWRRLSAQAPDEIEPHLQIARLASRAGDFETAGASAAAVLAIEPSHAEAQRLEQTARTVRRREAPGVSDWVQANAASAEARRTAVDAALAAGDVDSAIAILGARASSGADPALDRQRLTLKANLAAAAYVSEVEGRAGDAALAFWRLKEIAPDDPDFADGLNRMLNQHGSESASPPADAAVEGHGPTSVAAALGRGRLDQARRFAEQGHLEEAITNWREIQPLVATHPELGDLSLLTLESIRSNLAPALKPPAVAAELATAWGALEAATHLPGGASDEDRTYLLQLTREVFDQTPGTDSADLVALGRRLLAENPDDPCALRTAKALMHERRDGEALAIWQALSEKAPDAPEPYLQIARCARRLHRRDLGQAAARHLLELEPGHPEGLALANHFSVSGSNDPAASGAV